MWEVDQRLKKVIHEGGFKYDEKQHTEWFSAALLPHLWIPMGHQTIDMQEKTLEVAMKLEAAPKDETQLGVQQIQGQLEAMQMEIRNMRKGQEPEVSTLRNQDTRMKREPLLWCDDFRAKGLHDTNCWSL